MKRSPFKRLPVELQINIFELVPIHSTLFHLQAGYNKRHQPSAVLAVPIPTRHTLALTTTRKHISIESNKTIYTRNTFSFDMDPFLAHIGKVNAAHVRSIHIRIGSVIPCNQDFCGIMQAMASVC